MTAHIYVAGYVGPFVAFQKSAFALILAPTPDGLAIPRGRCRTPPWRLPDLPDDDTLVDVIEQASHGQLVLLFGDHRSFKAWQRKLASGEIAPDEGSATD